jgi:hypothetical protein
MISHLSEGQHMDVRDPSHTGSALGVLCDPELRGMEGGRGATH